jgi:hypothetical protein
MRNKVINSTNFEESTHDTPLYLEQSDFFKPSKYSFLYPGRSAIIDLRQVNFFCFSEHI